MKLHWRIFTNCTTEESAQKVTLKHFEKVGIPAASIVATPYHKGGFEVVACTEHEAHSWPEFVLHALSIAQRTGNAWCLSGNIKEELDAWSNSSTISGIDSIHIQAMNHA